MSFEYTIDQMSATVAENWDIPLDVATEHVTALVSQIADDSDLWDAEAERLTAAGEQIVSRQIEDSFKAQESADIVADVQSAVSKVATIAASLSEATDERDACIRAAIQHGQGVTFLADLTGLSRERIYQIRDGRR